jgi:hypothetical protein
MTTINDQIQKQIRESENETALYLQEEANENTSNLILNIPKSKQINKRVSAMVGGNW